MGFKSNCRASAPGHGVQQWGDMLGETVCDFSPRLEAPQVSCEAPRFLELVLILEGEAHGSWKS